jgi:hypothetical protein
MEDICLQATDNTPKVILSYNDGLIELEGRSYPENTFEFYEPILEWIKEYFDGYAKDLTTVNMKLTYFNSATTQTLFDMLDIIDDGAKNGLTFNWYYDSENENGLEDYEDFSEEFESLDIQAVAY